MTTNDFWWPSSEPVLGKKGKIFIGKEGPDLYGHQLLLLLLPEPARMLSTLSLLLPHSLLNLNLSLNL